MTKPSCDPLILEDLLGHPNSTTSDLITHLDGKQGTICQAVLRLRRQSKIYRSGWKPSAVRLTWEASYSLGHGKEADRPHSQPPRDFVTTFAEIYGCGLWGSPL